MPILRAIMMVVVTGLAPAALACGFHTYAPQETVIDKMVMSNQIVLARPDPQDPSRYVAVEAIDGGLANVEVSHLASSADRTRLSRNPEDTVLFAFDEFDRQWLRLAYVDEDLRSVIDVLATRLPAWRNGDDSDRLQMFAALYDHDSPTIQALALRELDLISYGELRALDFDPDARMIIPRLGLEAEADLLPIRVLLLGLSGDDDARDPLVRGLERNVDIEGRILGAYATAWIELDGTDAIAELGERYLVNESVSLATREMLIEAMAIHSATGAEAIQDAVRAAATDAVARSPALGPAVARQFGIRGDWSQRSALTTVLRQQVLRTPADLIAVNQYVALAAHAR